MYGGGSRVSILSVCHSEWVVNSVFSFEVSIHKAGPVYSRLVNKASAMDIGYAQQYINVVYSIYFSFFECLRDMVRVRVSGRVRASDSFVILLHFLTYSLG